MQCSLMHTFPEASYDGVSTLPGCLLVSQNSLLRLAHGCTLTVTEISQMEVKPLPTIPEPHKCSVSSPPRPCCQPPIPTPALVILLGIKAELLLRVIPVM